jgi:hypothetical protein
MRRNKSPQVYAPKGGELNPIAINKNITIQPEKWENRLNFIRTGKNI